MRIDEVDVTSAEIHEDAHRLRSPPAGSHAEAEATCKRSLRVVVLTQKLATALWLPLNMSRHLEALDRAESRLRTSTPRAKRFRKPNYGTCIERKRGRILQEFESNLQLVV